MDWGFHVSNLIGFSDLMECFTDPLLSDLWKWEDGIWTWMGGNSSDNMPAVYGELGVPHPENTPGGRMNGAAVVSGNVVYFYGGEHRFGPNHQECEKLKCPCSHKLPDPLRMMGDLWRLDGVTWTWIGGSQIPELPPNYEGAVEAPYPGARAKFVMWPGPSGNDFWLFGGQYHLYSGLAMSEGYSTISGFKNDMWYFDGSSWTWVGGDKANNAGKFAEKNSLSKYK